MDTQTATATAQEAKKAQLRGVKITIVSFVFCLIALIVAAVLMSSQFDDGPMLWAMVLMGAIIIGILLSAVFLPFMKEMREHR